MLVTACARACIFKIRNRSSNIPPSLPLRYRRRPRSCSAACARRPRPPSLRLFPKQQSVNWRSWTTPSIRNRERAREPGTELRYKGSRTLCQSVPVKVSQLFRGGTWGIKRRRYFGKGRHRIVAHSQHRLSGPGPV